MRLFPHTTVIYCALNSVTDSPKHDKKTRKKLPARIFLQGRWLISPKLCDSYMNIEIERTELFETTSSLKFFSVESVKYDLY